MLKIKVPGRGVYRLKHLVLDVNGTIAVEGRLIDGVAQRVAELRRAVEVQRRVEEKLQAAGHPARAPGRTPPDGGV